jgi:hypothetical protein
VRVVFVVADMLRRLVATLDYLEGAPEVLEEQPLKRTLA